MTDWAALYVHVPFCKSKCDYCDFFSLTGNPRWEDFTDSLLVEAGKRKSQFGVKALSSIYIGGGTPSLMPQSCLEKFFRDIFAEFDVSRNCEITIEVNPDDCTAEFCRFLAKSPINRISTGIQSMNDSVLKQVGRRSNRAKNFSALANLKKFCPEKNISADIIAGLPGETEESLSEGLKILTDFSVEHISLYSLMLSPETPLGEKVFSEKLYFNEDFSDKLWIFGRDFLTKNGYHQYEISNFCKNGKESLHNMTYWNGKNYFGIGPGAVGTVDAIRYENSTDVAKWMENPGLCSEEILSKEDKIFEFFMLGFRTAYGIETKIFEERFGEKIPDATMEVFEKWLHRSLLKKEGLSSGTRFRLTPRGMLFLNKFLEEIL